jgi:hypothetical protein
LRERGVAERSGPHDQQAKWSVTQRHCGFNFYLHRGGRQADQTTTNTFLGKPLHLAPQM